MCQTEKRAPGTVAIARLGIVVFASELASAEFYIPVSIEIALDFLIDIPLALPSKNPNKYPPRLSKITETKITIPVENILAALFDTIIPTIKIIAIIDIAGKYFLILFNLSSKK